MNTWKGLDKIPIAKERESLKHMLTGLGGARNTLRRDPSCTGHYAIVGDHGWIETANGKYVAHLHYDRPRVWQHVRRVLACQVLTEHDTGGSLLLDVPSDPERATLLRRWLGIRKTRTP